MAKIYVYNPATNVNEVYYRGLDEPMPYILGNSLTVREFRSNSNSNILWTDKRAMDAWNTLRRIWGKSIFVGFAFKRIWQGGHAPQSQHYAGVAFDIGQNLNSVERNQLRNAAYNSGAWSYVEPAYLTPTWVHVDKRTQTSACGAGFPPLRLGSKGVYVFVLQDALNAIGYSTGGLDGSFGNATRQAVINFQRANNINPDGIVGCSTWRAITSRANGIGRTPTVIQ